MWQVCCWVHDVCLIHFDVASTATMNILPRNVKHSRCRCESTASPAAPKGIVEQRVVTCYAVSACHTSEPFLPALCPWLATRHNCVRDSSFCWFLDVQDVTHATPLVDKTQPPCTFNSSLLQWYSAMFMSIFPSGQLRIRYSLTCASVWSRSDQIWALLRSDLSSAHRRRIQFFY